MLLKPVVKVIWHKAALPPHMDGWIVFARLCQCAALSNTCFFGPTRVYVPNGISICSAIFAQLMADSPCIYNGPSPSAWKLPLCMEETGLPSNTWFLEPTPQPKRHLYQLIGLYRAHDCDRPTVVQWCRLRMTLIDHILAGCDMTLLGCGLAAAERMAADWWRWWETG